MKEEKAKCRVLYALLTKGFSTPFEEIPLQREERGEIPFLVIMELKPLNDRLCEWRESGIRSWRNSLQPCVAVELSAHCVNVWVTSSGTLTLYVKLFSKG
jgi:hypothetical protein